MTIEFRPLSEALGAEVIGVNVADDHSDETIAVIRDGWLCYNILLFRGQGPHVGAAVGIRPAIWHVQDKATIRPMNPGTPRSWSALQHQSRWQGYWRTTGPQLRRSLAQ